MDVERDYSDPWNASLQAGGGREGTPLHFSRDLSSRACSLADMASSVHVKDSCKSNQTYLKQTLRVTTAESKPLLSSAAEGGELEWS